MCAMNHLKIINDYLKSKDSPSELPPTGYPFITISREAGSGGHLVGNTMVAAFSKETDTDLFHGWHVFDREICEIVAMDPTLHSTFGELLSERHQSVAHDFIEELFTGQSRVRSQFKKTSEIIRMLATLGKVILVGRGAGFVTRGLPSGIHMRLVAPLDKRVRAVSKKYNVSRADARRTILRQDSDRRKMVRTFFSRDIDDPLNYDIIWNTDTVRPDEITPALIEIIKLRAAKK